MPNIKLALTIEEMKLLEKEAEKEHLSVQDFIRYKLFSTGVLKFLHPKKQNVVRWKTSKKKYCSHCLKSMARSGDSSHLE